MYTFPQSYVGQVNVVGDCYCFGVATHLKAGMFVPVFLSVTGAASSVEALWARMAQGKASAIVRTNKQPSIALDPEEKGMYTRIQKKVAGLGIDHLLLLHRDLAEPTYLTTDDSGQLYLLWPNEVIGIAKLGEHIRKTVKVAVFNDWFLYLHQEGRVRRLVQPLQCFGGVEAVHVALHPKRWTELIADGLKRGRIALPSEHPSCPNVTAHETGITSCPVTLDTAGKRALYDAVGQNERQALALDATICRTRKDGWRGNLLKEREIRLAIRAHVDDEALAEHILELVKNDGDY